MTVSGAIAGDDTVNFSISETEMMSIQNNSSESCFKMWKVQTNQFFNILSGFGDLGSEKVKVSIFKGLDFSKKILSFFEVDKEKEKDDNQIIVELDIIYDPLYNMAKYIEIRKINKKTNKKLLSFKVATANALTNFVDFEPEMIAVLFNGASETINTKNIGELMITKEVIKEAKNLFKVQTDIELQQNYIAFKYEKETNQVILTDETIDLFLTEPVDPTVLKKLHVSQFEVAKDIFTLLDAGLDYKIEFKEYIDEFDRKSEIITFRKMVIGDGKKLDFELVTSVSVLIDVADDFNFDDLNNDQETFE